MQWSAQKLSVLQKICVIMLTNISTHHHPRPSPAQPPLPLLVRAARPTRSTWKLDDLGCNQYKLRNCKQASAISWIILCTMAYKRGPMTKCSASSTRSIIWNLVPPWIKKFAQCCELLPTLSYYRDKLPADSVAMHHDWHRVESFCWLLRSKLASSIPTWAALSSAEKTPSRKESRAQ